MDVTPPEGRHDAGPTLLVPDERSWVVWRRDVRRSAWVPAASPERARVLVVPEPLPEALVEPVRELWAAMGPGRRLHVLPAPWRAGVTAAEVLGEPAAAEPAAEGHGKHEEHGGHAGHGGHEGHGGDGGDGGHEGHGGDGHGGHGGDEGHGGHEGHMGHDHHAMMEVTGDPSEDGLVMEDLELALGPLSGVLPGGVAADLTLDGDVVAGCALRTTLQAGPGDPPDPTAPAAWSAATGADWAPPTIAAVELERAAGHAAWIARLGRLLGWGQLEDAARAVLAALPDAPAEGPLAPDALADAAAAAERLCRLAGGRRLAWRLRDLAVVAGAAPPGPAARAAGAAADARAQDEAYAALGFQPVTGTAGDAHARALVRVAEIAQSVRLAAQPGAGAAAAAVEGPRGPLSADADGRPSAPGEAGARAAAETAVVGLEWSAAVLALHSFDLSGWTVAG